MASEEDLKVFMDRNRRIENSPALQLERQRLEGGDCFNWCIYNLKTATETTKIEEVKESNYVIVIDPPEVPLHRSKPKRKIMVVFPGFLGLGLGILLAFIKDYSLNREIEEKEKM